MERILRRHALKSLDGTLVLRKLQKTASQGRVLTQEFVDRFTLLFMCHHTGLDGGKIIAEPAAKLHSGDVEGISAPEATLHECTFV